MRMIAAQVTSALTRSDSRERLKDSALTFTIFAIALGVRVHGLNFQPFWMDEITAIQRAGQPFIPLVSQSLTFHHLPTYFLLLSSLVPISVDETLMRLPSALCGALTASVSAGIGRTIGGRASGLMAGFLTAFSPLQVSFGQEARPQALVVLCITVALYGLVKLSRDPKAASLPLRNAHASRRAWATYFLATLAAMNVLGIALIWALTGWLATVFIAAHPDADRRRLLRTSGLLHGALAILTAPSYVAMFFLVHASGRLLEGLDWIPPVTIERLIADISSVYLLQISSPISFRLFPGAVHFIGTLVIAFAALGVIYLWRHRTVLAVLALAVAVLPLALLAISLFLPLWLPRYLLWSAIPFFIIAGLGVAMVPARTGIFIASAVGVLSFVNLVPIYGIEVKPRWDLAAAALKSAIDAQDLVLVNDAWVPRMMNVYLSRAGLNLPEGEWTSDIAVALTRLNQGGRVWVVFGRVGQVDREDPGTFRKRISTLGSPADEWQIGLDITILLFDMHHDTVRAGIDEQK